MNFYRMQILVSEPVYEFYRVVIQCLADPCTRNFRVDLRTRCNWRAWANWRHWHLDGKALLVSTITFYQHLANPSDRSANAQLLFTLPGDRIRSRTSLTDAYTIVT